MKRYKHRKTGQIFKEAGVSPVFYYLRENERITTEMLPAWVVEDSCDFEELKEVLFITEDGVEITDKDTIMYYVLRDTYLSTGNVMFLNSAVGMGSPNPNVLYFFSIKARDKYVSENRPLLSRKDVMDLDYTKFNGNNIVIKIRELDDLVKEKLK